MAQHLSGPGRRVVHHLRQKVGSGGRPLPLRWVVRLFAALLLVLTVVGFAMAFIATDPEQAEAWGVTQVATRLGIMAPARCSGICQACYCDQIINGSCYVNGRPSGCIGCVGSCVADDDCQCRPGRGGCGAVIAWCRDSDCQPQPTPAPTPTPVLTPTPTPPACTERIYDHIEPPEVVDWYYLPEYPTVVGQDPTFRGFDFVVHATGGWAERRQVVLEQVCPDGGTDPAACPTAWQWSCSTKVLEHHDDPLVAIDLPMRLADSSVEWLEDELRPRYPGTAHKEGLPRVFELWRGEHMDVTASFWGYPAQDPGIHGGKIIVTTKGTPLNEPQRIAVPYEVPVYLRDSTISR